MSDLISIIVPIYNVEKYLQECIESLLKQTYKNIEIILVDDGSPDNCPQICDEFLKKDKRIKVFHKVNGGLSDARNYGLERATGNYICFVDSDDFVTEDYIEFLYNKLILNNVDIAMCGFTNYYNDNKMKCKIKKVQNKIYDRELAHIYLNVLGYFDVASWNKIYKKELFNDVRFPVGKTCEDWRIMHNIIDKTNNVFYDSAIKYYYRRRENSITSSKKVRMDSIEAALDALEFYKQKKYLKVLPYAYQSLMIACMGVVNNMICFNDFSRYNYVDNIKKKYRMKACLNKLKFCKKIQLLFFMYFTKIYIRSIKILKR